MMYVTGADFKHADKNWWLRLPMTAHCRVQKPLRAYNSDTFVPPNDHEQWSKYVKDPQQQPDKAVLMPFLTTSIDGIKARDQARAAMHDEGFLVAYDVWWKRKPKTSKGFLPLPDATWFYRNMQCVLPPETMTFLQVLLPERICEFYFDIDVDNPGFPMEQFLQAMFEEMAREDPSLTVEGLWERTVLLDASVNAAGVATKSSCHGICKGFFFPSNHTSMKRFAENVKARLEQRWKQFLVKNKNQKLVIPLDTNVYHRYQNFRMLGHSKFVVTNNDQRPLVVAPYNQYANMPTDNEQIFLLTLVQQPEVNVAVEQEQAARQPATKRLKREAALPSGPLEAYLLQQLRAWGNASVDVSEYAPARKSGDKGDLYISFAGAQKAPDHEHQSNNLYAIVKPRHLQIFWHCHDVKCKPWKQALPMAVALKIRKQ